MDECLDLLPGLGIVESFIEQVRHSRDAATRIVFGYEIDLLLGEYPQPVEDDSVFACATAFESVI